MNVADDVLKADIPLVFGTHWQYRGNSTELEWMTSFSMQGEHFPYKEVVPEDRETLRDNRILVQPRRRCGFRASGRLWCNVAQVYVRRRKHDGAVR
jgi:hypothetical protein